MKKYGSLQNHIFPFDIFKPYDLYLVHWSLFGQMMYVTQSYFTSNLSLAKRKEAEFSLHSPSTSYENTSRSHFCYGRLIATNKGTAASWLLPYLWRHKTTIIPSGPKPPSCYYARWKFSVTSSLVLMRLQKVNRMQHQLSVYIVVLLSIKVSNQPPSWVYY